MSHSLARFNPFGKIARFEQTHDFDDLFRDLRFLPALRGADIEPRINIDVAETDLSYTVKAEIPGVNKDDIKVEVDKNQVSISAETKRDGQTKDGDTIVRNERYIGQQFRSFTLAKDIDDVNVTATYQDGVLELTLPKKAKPAGKKIVIN